MESTETRRLLEELVSSGRRVKYELAEEIRKRPDAIPYLVEFVREDKYWDSDGPGEGWAPIHAVHLLSAMKSREGLEAIEEILRTRPDDLGDWLTEETASLLANFDEAGVDTIRGLVSDRNLDIFIRNAAIRALNVIAHRHPELRAHTTDLYLKLMRGERDNGAFLDLNALEFAQLKDKAIYEEIKSLYEGGLVKGESCDFGYIEEVQVMPDVEMDYHRDDKDPMEHFRPENLERWEGLAEEEETLPSKEGHLPKVSVRIGRNDPCPCGSGKKFKKCCWWRDKGLELPSR